MVYLTPHIKIFMTNYGFNIINEKKNLKNNGHFKLNLHTNNKILIDSFINKNSCNI